MPSQILDWRTLPKEQALLFFYGGRLVTKADEPFFRDWEKAGLLRTRFSFFKRKVVAYLTKEGCDLVGKDFTAQCAPKRKRGRAKCLTLPL